MVEFGNGRLERDGFLCLLGGWTSINVLFWIGTLLFFLDLCFFFFFCVFLCFFLFCFVDVVFFCFSFGVLWIKGEAQSVRCFGMRFVGIDGPEEVSTILFLFLCLFYFVFSCFFFFFFSS